MKGFARILEAVIASIILIATLTFFFAKDTGISQWSNVNLQTISQDLLETAYLNGTIRDCVMKNDKQSLNIQMSRILPRTVDFSLRVKGIPNDIIRIACIDCGDAEVNELLKIINTTEFEYHGRQISMRVESVNLTLFNSRIPEETNVMFFFDKNKLNSYRQKADIFLSSGGSVFLLDDLVQADTNGYIGHIFNLTWYSSAIAPASIYDVYGAKNISHYVAKYYANLSGRNIADVTTNQFTFLSGNIAPTRDERNIVTSGNNAYGRANYQVNVTKGRAIWFADYNRADHTNPATASTDRLLKASMMWASGESYSMDVTRKTPAPIHFSSEIIIYDQDTYIFELTVWQVFL